MTRCFRKSAFLRLNTLRSSFKSSKHNWVQQLADLLTLINEAAMLGNVRPAYWKAEKSDLINKFNIYLRNLNQERYYCLKACRIIYPILLYKLLSDFERCPDHLIKPVIQLRLTSIYSSCIFIDQETLKLSPLEPSNLCHLLEEETVLHFISRCPFYSDIRAEILVPDAPSDYDLLGLFLGSSKPPVLIKTFAFLKKCYRKLSSYSLP